MPEENKCFVISPIGEEGTEKRERADDVLNNLIRPVASEFDYDVRRADEIAEPGMITFQIIQHLANDQLVIADCTDQNANVFYELAVRHAAKKPVIQMIKKEQSQKIPFDVDDMRTVMISRESFGAAEECKEELKRQISAIEEGSEEDQNTYSPISSAVELSSLRGSENPIDKQFEKIISKLEGLSKRISQIEQQKYVPRPSQTDETPSGAMPATELTESEAILNANRKIVDMLEKAKKSEEDEG